MYSIGPFEYSFKGEENKKIFSIESFEINPGDFVLISGPSGAGKSSFLQMLKGIIPHYSSGKLKGEILYKKKLLSAESFKENLSEILFLFQNPFSQMIYSQVAEEFYFTMENFNYTQEEMRNQKSLFEESFDLNRIWNKKTNQLSNGESQKLVLSSLLAVGPKVLLLDEPTAFLDPAAREHFYHWLAQIKGKFTIVIVDHHIREVLQLFDFCVKIEESGEIKKVDKTHIQINSQSISKQTPKLSKLFCSSSSLQVKDLSFSYEKQAPLYENLNFELNSGKIAVLTGRNGEGKSTLLKLIAGFLKPQSGQLNYYQDNKLIDRKKSLSNFAMIFQNPESHFFFDTIKEELASVEKEKVYQDWIKYFFNSINLNKSPHLLSEGEKRRLSIFLSLMQQRSVILYDEPTFGLDSDNKDLVFRTILELKDLQTIQFIISHDNDLIETVADIVFELDKGIIVERNAK